MASAPTPNEDAIQAHATRNAGEGAAPPDKKRGPYKPRAGSKPTSTLVQAHETVDAKRAAFRKVGHGIADALILGGRTLGGPIWEPVLIKDEKGIIIHDERTNLREAWADMAESYEWEKFPPWLGATIVTASYVGPRMFHEQTLSRIDKLKMWWAGRKAKKAEQTEKTKDGAGA